MAGESIKPFGVDDLRDEFSGLEKRAKAQYMPKAIRAGVDVLLDGMRRRVPQRTGRLHDSLRVEKVRGGAAATFGIFTDVFYWYMVEFGTKSYKAGDTRTYTEGRSRRERRRRVVRGHSGMRARPFARTTVDEDKGKAVDEARDVLERAMIRRRKRAAKRG